MSTYTCAGKLCRTEAEQDELRTMLAALHAGEPFEPVLDRFAAMVKASPFKGCRRPKDRVLISGLGLFSPAKIPELDATQLWFVVFHYAWAERVGCGQSLDEIEAALSEGEHEVECPKCGLKVTFDKVAVAVAEEQPAEQAT